jgi:hypothetical protein
MILPQHSSSVQEWFMIAEWLSVVSVALIGSVQIFAHLDRWWVQYHGEHGHAVLQDLELVQTYPRKIWAIKLKVIPEDPSDGEFRSRPLWKEGTFDPLVHTVGTTIPVRFRRMPRPIVMPEPAKMFT